MATQKVKQKNCKTNENKDFTSEKIEDDPAWKALHKPAKIKHYIPPEKLEELIEQEMIGNLLAEFKKPQSSTSTTNTSKNSKPPT